MVKIEISNPRNVVIEKFKLDFINAIKFMKKHARDWDENNIIELRKEKETCVLDSFSNLIILKRV